MSNDPMNAALEKGIAAALVGDITSADVATLIAETEAAVTQAVATAEAEHEKAHDLLASPDADKARAAIEDAAFTRDRLRTALPRLQARFTEVQAAEYRAQWQADFEALNVKRDALAAELREVYPDFETKITGLFARIAANDVELSRLHQGRPPGVALHLRSAELEARGLECFTRSEPPIVARLKLPTFKPGERLAWPPPERHEPVSFAPMVLGDPRLTTGDWWQVRQEQAQTAAERAAREEKEREAKALENYHGPRWWEQKRG